MLIARNLDWKIIIIQRSTGREEEKIARNAFKLAKVNYGPQSLKSIIRCVAWNVQSIRNKCDKVLEHIVDYEADIVFLSETWMESQKNDITAMVKQRGYKMLHNRRLNREKEVGGGVGVLVNSSLYAKQLGSKDFSSFEHTMVIVKLEQY